MSEFERIKRLPPYVFSIVTDLKMKARRAGEDIIDLGMGNPDLPTPPHIVNKLVEAATKPKNHRYSLSRCIPKLELAICDLYKPHHYAEFDFDPEAIAKIGAKEALSHLMVAFTSTGDVVI